MSDFTILGGDAVKTEALNVDTSSTNRLNDINTSASADTYGSWVELIASTSFDYDGLVLATTTNTNAESPAILDIGVGGAGSEVVVAEALPLTRPEGTNALYTFKLPISISAGSRIAARAKDSEASANIVALTGHGYSSGFLSSSPFSRAKSFGLTGSTGTNVDAGGTIHTKGSWTELDASVSEDIKAFSVCVDGGNDTTRGDVNYLLDIGVGGAGSEVTILENYFCRSNASEFVFPPYSDIYQINIPQGSRLSGRVQADTTTASTRHINVSIVGYY